MTFLLEWVGVVVPGPPGVVPGPPGVVPGPPGLVCGGVMTSALLVTVVPALLMVITKFSETGSVPANGDTEPTEFLVEQVRFV